MIGLLKKLRALNRRAPWLHAGVLTFSLTAALCLSTSAALVTPLAEAATPSGQPLAPGPERATSVTSTSALRTWTPTTWPITCPCHRVSGYKSGANTHLPATSPFTSTAIRRCWPWPRPTTSRSIRTEGAAILSGAPCGPGQATCTRPTSTSRPGPGTRPGTRCTSTRRDWVRPRCSSTGSTYPRTPPVPAAASTIRR